MHRRRLLLGLGALPLLMGASPRATYRRAHRRLTEKLLVYHEFSTALLLRATLLTPAFRQALALERQRLMNPTVEDHAAFVARMAADGAAYHEVVFAADSALRHGKDFGPGDDAWNVRLEVDGTAPELVAVEHVADPTPLHRTVYLQHTKWSDLWIARWARAVDRPTQVVLTVGSGYGNGQVTWDLQTQDAA